MNTPREEKSMSTADFAAAGESPEQREAQLRQQAAFGDQPMGQDAMSQRSLPRDTGAQGMAPQGVGAGGSGTPDRAAPQGTAAFAAASHAQEAPPRRHEEPLAALFDPQTAEAFRARWDAVQIGFVDDPRQAVQQADELVATVMKTLAENFASQRASIESDVGQGEVQGSTENLRMALRSYRSFFQRLLSL